MNLAEKEQERIGAALEAHEAVESAALFGSRALGCARPESDIDLAVYGDIPDEVLCRIAGDLEELPLPYRFDVQAYTAIRHEGLRRHIDRHGVVIYRRKQ